MHVLLYSSCSPTREKCIKYDLDSIIHHIAFLSFSCTSNKDNNISKNKKIKNPCHCEI